MFENFTQNRPVRDACFVKNESEMEQIRLSRKEHSQLFHLLYALITSAFFVFAVAFPCSFIGLLCMCICPAMLVYTYLYSKIEIKILSTFLAPLSVGIMYVAKILSPDFVSVSVSTLAFLVCIATSAVLTKSAVSSYRKDTFFVLVTITYGVLILFFTATLFVYFKGSFSPKLLINSINGFFGNMYSGTVAVFESEQFLPYLEEMAKEAQMTNTEILSLLKDATSLTLTSIKMILPSLFILTCMLFSAVTSEIFTRLAKRQKIALFVGIAENKTCYRPTNVTATFYDLIFFAYVIVLLFPIPQNVTITVINLLLVMTPVFIVPGIRGIYAFLLVKTKEKKVLCLTLTILSIVISLTILSSVGLFIIASIGVWFVKKTNNMANKLISGLSEEEIEYYKKLFEKAVPGRKNDTNDGNSIADDEQDNDKSDNSDGNNDNN